MTDPLTALRDVPTARLDAAPVHARIDELIATKRRRRLPALALAATAAAAAAVVLTTGGTPTTTQPAAATAATVLHALGQRAADQAPPQLAAGQYYAVRVNQRTVGDTKHSGLDSRTWAQGTEGRELVLVNGKEKRDVPLGTPPADGVKYLPWPDLASFPTEPAALAAKLREVAKGPQLAPGEEPSTRDYVVAAMQMIFDHRQTPPDVLRGIYDFLAKLPGIRLIGDVKDPLGRPGKAVAIDGDSQIHEGIGIELILAPDTGLPLAAVHYRDGDVNDQYVYTTRQEGVVTGTDTLPG